MDEHDRRFATMLQALPAWEPSPEERDFTPDYVGADGLWIHQIEPRWRAGERHLVERRLWAPVQDDAADEGRWLCGFEIAPDSAGPRAAVGGSALEAFMIACLWLDRYFGEGLEALAQSAEVTLSGRLAGYEVVVRGPSPTLLEQEYGVSSNAALPTREWGVAMSVTIDGEPVREGWFGKDPISAICRGAAMLDRVAWELPAYAAACEARVSFGRLCEEPARSPDVAIGYGLTRLWRPERVTGQDVPQGADPWAVVFDDALHGVPLQRVVATSEWHAWVAVARVSFGYTAAAFPETWGYRSRHLLVQETAPEDDDWEADGCALDEDVEFDLEAFQAELAAMPEVVAPEAVADPLIDLPLPGTDQRLLVSRPFRLEEYGHAECGVWWQIAPMWPVKRTIGLGDQGVVSAVWLAARWLDRGDLELDPCP